MFTFLFATLLVCTAFGQSTIPLPTASQYAYQAREIVGLTHFNMATFFGDGDPSCNKNNWEGVKGSGNPLSFNPTNALNISNWVESYKAIGAKSAVLTAKHGCGFALWATKVLIPSTNGSYNYSILYSSYTKDIVKEFVTILRDNGLGVGFYYSLTNNFYLNVHSHNVQPSNTLIPGQQNITQSQFEQLAKEQLTELFTEYGNLTEFWFDGGTGNLGQIVADLIKEYQPSMAVFGGQGITPNSVRWIGTESGIINQPIWSLGYDNNPGSPNGTVFCPACCDTTLQNGDHWFYTPSAGIRSLATLIDVYHDTVGNNGVLEMDFAIDQTGNVAPDQAQRYKEFGDWINKCYGNPLNKTNGVISNSNNNMIQLEIINNVAFDRLLIQENLLQGERARSYQILVNDKVVASSTAIGYKKIVLLKTSHTGPATITLKVTYVGDSVAITNFAAFAACPSS